MKELSIVFHLLNFRLSQTSLLILLKKVFEPFGTISASSSNVMYCPLDRDRKEESFLFNLILLISLGSIKE